MRAGRNGKQGQTGSEQRLPIPHFNVINGGEHAANELAFQEFMIAPLVQAAFRKRWNGAPMSTTH
nr:hypothetical protein [Arthrobacter sp. lap29]